jgi:hypothetical protein
MSPGREYQLLCTLNKSRNQLADRINDNPFRENANVVDWQTSQESQKILDRLTGFIGTTDQSVRNWVEDNVK